MAPRLLAPLLWLSLLVPAAPVAVAEPLRMDTAGATGAGAAPAAATWNHASPPAAAAASAIEPGSVNRTSINVTATYAVTATLAVDTGRLHVMTTITARNYSGAGVHRLDV